eukprot:1042407-Prorocentrum_minimum.AAC.1
MRAGGGGIKKLPVSISTNHFSTPSLLRVAAALETRPGSAARVPRQSAAAAPGPSATAAAEHARAEAKVAEQRRRRAAAHAFLREQPQPAVMAEAERSARYNNIGTSPAPVVVAVGSTAPQHLDAPPNHACLSTTGLVISSSRTC